MRSGGAVDKLLDMLALPEEYDVVSQLSCNSPHLN